jgi:hypothetical protein
MTKWPSPRHPRKAGTWVDDVDAVRFERLPLSADSPVSVIPF